MVIDKETFTEVAVHLKLASDAVLTTARHLAVIQTQASGLGEGWDGALASLLAVNSEITAIEQLLRALMEANTEEVHKKTDSQPN